MFIQAAKLNIMSRESTMINAPVEISVSRIGYHGWHNLNARINCPVEELHRTEILVKLQLVEDIQPDV